jgi:hypothetical protein
MFWYRHAIVILSSRPLVGTVSSWQMGAGSSRTWWQQYNLPWRIYSTMNPRNKNWHTLLSVTWMLVTSIVTNAARNMNRASAPSTTCLGLQSSSVLEAGKSGLRAVRTWTVVCASSATATLGTRARRRAIVRSLRSSFFTRYGHLDRSKLRTRHWGPIWLSGCSVLSLPILSSKLYSHDTNRLSK